MWKQIKRNIFPTLISAAVFLNCWQLAQADEVKKDITFQQLKNATYKIPNQQGKWVPVTLTNGSGGRGKEVMLGLEKAALGDLSNDGVNDAAAIYWLNTGDDNYWQILGAFLSENGEAVNVDNKTLGVRVSVTSIKIIDGRIELQAQDATNGAPVNKMLTYVIKNKQLVQTENVVPKPVKPKAPPVDQKKTPVRTRNLS